MIYVFIVFRIGTTFSHQKHQFGVPVLVEVIKIWGIFLKLYQK